jgi:SAM-dependent methyltransferase
MAAPPETIERRRHIHQLWASVAPRWAAYADEVDARAAQLTERLLAAAALRPGDRVLELACGPGGAGMAAAERVGPDGSVVLSDVVEEMVRSADARRRERKLGNVDTAVLDIEDIDQPDASFDVVLCREGLMFAVEPEVAMGEVYRVLTSSGRAAVSVWGSRVDNPWLGLVMEGVGDIVGTPVPPAGMPGPFALGDDARVRRLLEHAGFCDVGVTLVDVPLRVPSFEAWWIRTTEIAGPAAGIIARLNEADRLALQDRLRAAARPYATDAGIEFPGRALIAAGRRP